MITQDEIAGVLIVAPILAMLLFSLPEILKRRKR